MNCTSEQRSRFQYRLLRQAARRRNQLMCRLRETAAAQAEYRSFVNAKLGCEERLWDQVTNAIYLGTSSWTKRMREFVERKPRSTDHPGTQRAVGRPAMHEVIAAVGKVAQLPRDVVRSIRGGPLRNLAAWLGWHEGLVTLKSIAAALRLRSEGHISNP